MDKSLFRGENLKLARLAAGLKQVEVAELVSASANYISELERDLRKPDEILARALGEVLGFETEFFYRELPEILSTEEVNFRHRHSTPRWLKAKVTAKALLFRQVVEYLDTSLGFPEYDVPDIRAKTQTDIERAAETCREHWGLGIDTPIHSMVRVAENAGIVVTEFEEAEKVDAFSVTKDGRGVIVLNTVLESTSRSRWNVAHEIGHLVLHRGLVTGDKVSEQQADWFAAGFLLPAAAFCREFGSMARVDWTHLLELKRRWKVALAATIRRGFDLGLLSAVTYRRLYKSLSARGWRKGEPHEPPPESPEIMKMAISALEEQFGLTSRELASKLLFRGNKMTDVTGFVIPELRPENVTDFRRFRAERKQAG